MVLDRQAAKGGIMRAYVGTITARGDARGDGIHAYHMDPTTGAWTHFQHLGQPVNPTFFITNRKQSVLYSAHAVLDYATSYAIDRATGQLSPINRAATGGENGVSLALDPTERFMVVVNYGSGSVAVLPVAKDGALADYTQLVALPGEPRPGRRIERQESSHPHDVHFDPSGRFVVIPDLGLDRVWIFRFDPEKGRLEPSETPFAASRGGAGPRHLAFHANGKILWVASELESTVSTYRWDSAKGALSLVEVVSTLPADFTGDNTVAEIGYHRGSHTLYVSNRGHDSVAAMRVNRSTGAPALIGTQSTLGSWPRFFKLDPTGRFLYMCNQNGHNIVPFAVDPQSGALTPTASQLQVGSPVTIAFTTTRR